MSEGRTVNNSTIVRHERLKRGPVDSRPRKDEHLQTSTLHARRHHSITTIKGLIEELDRLTSLIVRERDGHRCVQCGSAEEITNGHIYSRSFYATRWDIHPDGNCHAQCWRENKIHRWNKDPFMFWFIGEHGGPALSAIRERAHKGRKLIQAELEEQVEEYRHILRSMK